MTVSDIVYLVMGAGMIFAGIDHMCLWRRMREMENRTVLLANAFATMAENLNEALKVLGLLK